ncbi:hypothetical protein [Paenibacillus sp. OV219]|uniref:hypothetical protein n=1 Tax=Paenibacillus sp. OV219 TaxID=1884377 RepID=UPI0008D55404|nr:hypothetical protein [Paenibacillus sp. OV219]SEO38836.1 hypothetical protein SAMN05518847_107267 [Paenibacillus sp. OV219]
MLHVMKGKAFSALLIILIAVIGVLPGAAAASSVKLTSAAQASLGKQIAAASPQMRDKLQAQSLVLSVLQQSEDTLDKQIKTLHDNNGNALTAVRERIKGIDADRLSKLAQDAASTREKYKPLLSLYTSLNTQIKDAKSLKLKTLASLLQAQADGLKLAVTLARADIRARDDALRVAKAAVASKVKHLRAMLAEITPLRDQISSVHAVISGTKKNISPVVTTLNASMKNGTFEGTLQSLTTLVSLSRTIVEQKQRISSFESRISGIITATNAQIPAKS